MNDIDKMPSKCRDCAYWELAREPYVCTDCDSRMERLSDLSKPMPNDDYIKRSDCIDSIKKAEKWWWNADDLREYREIFESIPAADVEPVRHGWWEYDSDHIPHCSECETIALQRHKLYLEEKIYDVPFVLSKRCPECGAKMDAEPQKEEDNDNH